MDLKKYIEKKQSGLAEIVKAGGGYAIAFKRWDAGTGELLEPEIQALDQKEVFKKKSELQQEIKDIDAVIAEAKALV
jgi:hypothetical protein